MKTKRNGDQFGLYYLITIFILIFSEEALAARRGSVLTPLPGPGSFKKKNQFFQKKKVFASAGGGCPAGFGRGYVTLSL